MKKLTVKQRAVLDFIIKFIAEESVPPTYQEIADNFKFKSPTAANDHCKALEKKGYITKKKNRSRHIVVVASAKYRNKPLVELTVR